MAAAQDFSFDVRELAAELRTRDGQLEIPDEVFARWRIRLATAAPLHRAAIMTDLIALGLRLSRVPAGASCADRVAELVEVVAAGGTVAHTTFDRRMSREMRAAKLLGLADRRRTLPR
jgi:hypothetical protein